MCQKAPSAKRCIKTSIGTHKGVFRCRCQKAPSAKRCIKTVRALAVDGFRSGDQSESTKRQKVH